MKNEFVGAFRKLRLAIMNLQNINILAVNLKQINSLLPLFFVAKGQY